MLDSDAPTGTTEGANDENQTQPTPRRRRRAASRPAGPPRAIEPVTAPAAIAPPEAEPETVEIEWTEVAAETVTVEAAPPVVEAVTPESEETEESEESEETETEDVRADEEAGRLGDAAEPQADEEQAADEVGEALEALEADLDRETDAEIDAELQPEEAAPRTRRRRSARKAAPKAEASADDVAAALDNLAASLGTPADDADADSDDQPEDAEADQEATDEGDSAPRRRRRRRGGRRRRRSADGETGDEPEDDGDDESEGDETDDSDENAEAEASEGEADDTGGSSSSGRRRRRRRRRGEDTSADDEDGVDVVVKVREPRRTKPSASDEITGIEGSTRMEAKRQRRREGRAAGRRRAPILSEAEFLARRESVERQMLIRQADDYTQIGVLEDGVLAEHYVDRDSSASLIGNIYVGRVQNVLPSMEAAFIDIGRGRNAVLYAGEVDWDSFGVTGDDRKVEKVLKSGQSVLVQVTKDPVGAKGARLTAHISIPGRYVVYCPGGQLSGISRKLPDPERQRLKAILDEAVGSEASVIVRTAAEGASEEELVRDVNRLKAQWEVIEKKKSGSAPQLLYAEPDLTVRIVRDLFTEDFTSLVVDGNGQGEDAWEMIEAYVTHVAPHLADRLRHWNRETEGDLFEVFRLDEQVSKALERKVHLPSGGSLIIDRTEAMTVIDVNTGKFTGTQGNLEATVTSNNLEAAEEIVRQLRLRDIGGIIVIDFIDMVLPANRELLLRRLVECLGRDRTRHQVAEVTSLGLVQMTRKKIGTGLHEAFTVPCETCGGRGYHVHDAPVATQAPADGGDRESRSASNASGGGTRRTSRSRRPSADKAEAPVESSGTTEE
ncbi:Rne/Rng family ribonuclease [Propioniciclava sp.]|uniref:Rne/Rng family ribonuclease n=1 Tax=Propioniciclava sp. TaxID=2038686 RepID=UPI0026291DA0|nr:Rne/Rng family ribonuclease [Propioniciclava sp.]